MLRSALVALAAGLVLQPLAIRLLSAQGVLDRPSARSSHVAPTVRGGGIVVVAALTLGALSAGAAHGRDVRLVLLAVLLCAAVGAAEDLHGVPVLRRFVLLLLATAPLAGLVSGPGAAARVAAGACAVCFGMALVNAVNFMDGINGISVAQGLVAGVTYALLASAAGLDAAATVAGATAGAFLSFAPYNAPRARAFLGDSGSYGLGAALAGLAVLLLVRGLPPEAVLGPLALYVADTGTTLVRRYRRGEPWHLPHRTHVYQRLTDVGLSHTVVSGTVLVLGAVCAGLGAASLGEPAVRVPADLALAAVVAGYLALPRMLATRAPAG